MGTFHVFDLFMSQFNMSQKVSFVLCVVLTLFALIFLVTHLSSIVTHDTKYIFNFLVYSSNMSFLVPTLRKLFGTIRAWKYLVFVVDIFNKSNQIVLGRCFVFAQSKEYIIDFQMDFGMPS